MRGRILLQDLDSKSYLASDGAWSPNCQQAHVFEHTYMALLKGLDQGNRHTQVVWCFRNPSANLYMAVRAIDNSRLHPCDSCPLAPPHVQNEARSLPTHRNS